MAWFANLADRAENLLTTIDEQTGVALRKTNKIYDRHDSKSEQFPLQKKKLLPPRAGQKKLPEHCSRSPPPIYNKEHQRQPRATQIPREAQQLKQRKSPTKRKSPFDLNNSPETLVEIIHDDRNKFRQEGDTIIVDDETLTFRMQNLEVENAMLKNELNVMNTQLTELLGRLRKTEDEVNKNEEAVSRAEVLEAELNKLQESHKELSHHLKSIEDASNNNNSANSKLESDLRQAQTTIEDLQTELDKSKAESKRLESDWKIYKSRVKSTLHAKDKEIKSMQEGMNLTEDTKMLIEQIESLKEERENLTEAIRRNRGDNEEMRNCIEKLEKRVIQAERSAAALRETARDERTGRKMYENELLAVNEELKQIKMGYDKKLETLEMNLQQKEAEIKVLVDSPQSSSALTLNVGDVFEDQKRIAYMTDLVVKKQEAFEALTADFNTLKIHLAAVEEELTHTDKLLHNERTARHAPKKPNRVQIDKTCATIDLAATDGEFYEQPNRKLSPFFFKISAVNVFMIVYLITLHFFIGALLLAAAPTEGCHHA